jgi:hypothetical protein
MEFLTFLVSLTGTETITIGAMCGHLKQRKQNIVQNTVRKMDLILRSLQRMLQMQSPWPVNLSSSFLK